MVESNSTTASFKNSIVLFAYLLIVWGFYRNFMQFPEVVDELFFKPIIWLGGMYFFFYRERATLKSIGVMSKNLFPAAYFAIGLAVVFALEGLMVNFIKHGGFDFNANIGANAFFVALGLSVVTAITEELTFRGFIFGRVNRFMRDTVKASVVTSLGWSLIHLPVAIFVWDLPVQELLIYAVLVFIFSIGASWVYAKSGNILSPILLHVFWAWPIILFR